MFDPKSLWLGQVPLILGPSSWAAGMVPSPGPEGPIGMPYDPGRSLREGEELPRKSPALAVGSGQKL